MMEKFAQILKKILNTKYKKLEPQSGWRQAMRIFYGQYDIIFSNFGKFLLNSIAFMILFAAVIFCGKAAAVLIGENYALLSTALVTEGLLLVFVGALTIVKWYNVVFIGQDIFDFHMDKKVVLKIYALLLLWIALGLLPVLSIIMLYNRVVTPDWLWELAYFTFYALLAVVPVLSVRYLSVFAIVAGGEKIPTFAELYEKTRDKMRMIWFSLMFLLMMLTLLWIVTSKAEGIGGALFNVFLLVTALALFTNHCAIQKEQFINFEKK